jgi:hypothetical protein
MKKSLLMIFILSMIIYSPFAFAIPGGAEVTEGTSETGTETIVDTSSIEGGNVTFIDTYSKQITSNWAGFFGNISGAIVLQDSSSNTFFQWTITNFNDSVVYAASGAISNWGGANIVPANNTVVPGYISSAGLDNFTETFDSTGDFNSSSLNKGLVPYTATLNGGSGLRTYALYADNEGENIWAGVVKDDTTSFKGGSETVDYQILVPAQALTTYSFYLELP